MTLIIGQAHALAQLAASISFADQGADASKIALYTDITAASGAVPAGSPIAEITLAKPCGTIVAGTLRLNMANPEGTLVMTQGTPRAAQWISGQGLLVAAGTVTDAEHDGDFQLLGGVTAPGDDAPLLYAGGLVLLGDVVLS